MSAQESEVAAQANGAAKPKKAPTEYLTVEMEDGSKDQFVIGKNGPKKMNKYYDLNENGTFKHARFNFVNGRVLPVVPPASLHGQFLGHGAIQKYGDELAGLKPAEGQSEVDPDDMYLTLEELNENIQQGKWSTRAAGDGLGGTSLLIQALMEYGGKPLEVIKAFLKDKDKTFKDKLKLDDKRKNAAGLTMKQIVDRIQTEKASKGAKVDTSAALDDLDAMGASA